MLISLFLSLTATGEAPDLLKIVQRLIPMLQLNSVAFEYSDKPLFHSVNFTVPAGKLLHLRGENGAGKTTLLRVLTGLLKPSQGSICYNGQDIQSNIKHYQQQICYVGHQSGLNDFLTVHENCLYNLQTHAQKDVSALLKHFELNKLAHTLCYQLSAGQKRRVALLRAALSTAFLWLLDEPFNAFDQHSIELYSDLLRQHLEKKGHIILTSHQALPENLVVDKEYHLS